MTFANETAWFRFSWLTDRRCDWRIFMHENSFSGKLARIGILCSDLYELGGGVYPTPFRDQGEHLWWNPPGGYEGDGKIVRW